MKHSFRQEDGNGILELQGKLMGESEDLKIINMIDDFAKDGIINIVVDFSKVEWTNSRGVGICMSGREALQNAGGDLRLAGMCEKVSSIFEKTLVITLFQSFNTVEEAVASFK